MKRRAGHRRFKGEVAPIRSLADQIKADQHSLFPNKSFGSYGVPFLQNLTIVLAQLFPDFANPAQRLQFFFRWFTGIQAVLLISGFQERDRSPMGVFSAIDRLTIQAFRSRTLGKHWH